MAMAPKQLQREVARRLKELRKTVGRNASPETIAARARERNLRIASRTIRDLESPGGNPRLLMLHTLLSIYDTNLGDFFLFLSQGAEGRDIAEYLEMAKYPKVKEAIKNIYKVHRDEAKTT